MRRRSSSSAGAIVLPITPMLDMTFQLLFFLVLTMKPASALEGDLKLGRISSGTRIVCPTEPEPAVEPGAPLTIAVRAHPDQSGAIDSLTLRALEGEWTFEDTTELERHLAARRQAGPIVPVLLKPDSHLRFAAVIEVIELCRRAGFAEIGFAS